MRTSARWIALPVALLAAGAGLSGCSEVGRGDVAATVNGTVISEQKVADATAQLRSNPGFAKVTPLDVTQMLALGVVAQPIAEKLGVALSTDDAKGIYGAKAAGVGPDGLEVLRINRMIVAQLQGGSQTFTNAFVPAVAAAKVEVNPRFGRVERAKDGLGILAEPLDPWFTSDPLADKAATPNQ